MSARPAGGVWAMGRNTNGQLGLGAADDDAHPTAAQLAALGSGVVQVAAGSYHSAALTAGGEVYLWGRNNYGQIGRVHRSDTYASWPDPTRVALGTDTVQLALGSGHALALKQGGAVFGWGNGGHYGLGLGDTDNRLSPCQVTGLGTDNAHIAAQSTTGMALKSDGRLFNWGQNDYNNLGDDTTTELSLIHISEPTRPY